MATKKRRDTDIGKKKVGRQTLATKNREGDQILATGSRKVGLEQRLEILKLINL